MPKLDQGILTWVLCKLPPLVRFLVGWSVSPPNDLNIHLNQVQSPWRQKQHTPRKCLNKPIMVWCKNPKDMEMPSSTRSPKGIYVLSETYSYGQCVITKIVMW